MVKSERIDRLIRRPHPVEYTRVFRFLPPIVGRVIERAKSEIFQGYRLENH